MLWLDSNYPTNGDASTPELLVCATTSGQPNQAKTTSPNASVTFSNTKFGDLDSTF
ncbi:Exoglucanase 1 [Leucoagaricus gongylophorus]